MSEPFNVHVRLNTPEKESNRFVSAPPCVSRCSHRDCPPHFPTFLFLSLPVSNLFYLLEANRAKGKKDSEMALMCNRYSTIPFEGHLLRNRAFSYFLSSFLLFFLSFFPLAYFLSVLIFPQTWNRVQRASVLDGFDVCVPLSVCVLDFQFASVCVCVLHPYTSARFLSRALCIQPL